jgi:hypothetical protein
MRRSRAPFPGFLIGATRRSLDHRGPAAVDGADNLARIDPLEANRRDPEVRMSELPLDEQRDPLVRHLDRVGVPELARREPPPHPGLGRQPAKLTPRSPERTARGCQGGPLSFRPPADEDVILRHSRCA